MQIRITRRAALAMTAAAAAIPLGRAFAADRTISGTATYRERIALPPDASLTVRLGVMSGKEVGSHLIAEQIVAPANSVPIPFALKFDTADTPEGAALGLDAVITAGGETLFRTAEAIPLSDADAPIEILMVSGGREPAPVASEISGVEWQVVAITGIEELGEARPTLAIGADGAAAGSTGCNRFFAKARIDGESLTFSEAGTTFMACADPVMRIERGFLDALKMTAAYRLEDGVLKLLDGDGEAVMQLSTGA